MKNESQLHVNVFYSWHMQIDNKKIMSPFYEMDHIAARMIHIFCGKAKIIRYEFLIFDIFYSIFDEILKVPESSEIIFFYQHFLVSDHI